MPDQQGFSYAHWTAVNAVGYTLLEVKKDTTNDPTSVYFPSKGTISHVEVQLNTIAGGPTKVTVLATWDSSGALLALPATQADLSPAYSGATEGGVVISADNIQYQQGQGATPMKFYVAVKLDAGTANARVRVYWKR